MIRKLAILLLFAASWLRAETVKGLPKPTGYVSDAAGVLGEESRRQIEQQCTALHQQSGTQIAVVTIKTLEGATAQEFAHGISDAWGVGSKGTDKGIVLLVVTQDRKRWIDVGYGLEGVLNDAKVGDIGRDMVPSLSVGRYAEGISTGVREISEAILADTSTATPPQVAAVHKPAHSNNLWLVVLFLFLGIAGVIFLVLWRLSRSSTPHRSFVDTDNSSSYAPALFSSTDTSSSSESSSSSDSSSDSSSSSDSGSDFGGFDGGSSGGGGAGGDF